MLKKFLLGAAAASLALLSGSVQAQTYSNTVMSLGPAAYWPLTETTAPSGGLYIATNLGSLGSTGQGYYETWWQTNGATAAMFNSNSIVHVPGAVVGDADQALQQGAVGQYIVVPRITNGVPNPAVTLTPPFTIELWVYPTNLTGSLRPILAEGFNNIQATNLNYTNVNQGVGIGMFNNFLYFNTFNGAGLAPVGRTEIDTGTLAVSNWTHIVATFDGTSQKLYTNGALVRSVSPGNNSFGQNFVPDLISPLIIGGGNDLGISGGANNLFGGAIDEVAIYKTALSQTQATNHYSNGTNSLRSQTYPSLVVADNPTMYFRLDEPAFAGAGALNSYPVANNYGAVGAAANGNYLPGTTPGVAGPAFSGFGSPSRAVALNGFNAGVDVGNGNLPLALNPTNKQPVTVTAWFKGNPADAVGRFQTIVGHSDASWRLNMDLNAGVQFNPGNGPQLQFANVADEFLTGMFVNDGNWHFVAGVCDGTNDSLYIDGTLAKSGTGAGVVATGSPLDIVLGGDPQYTAPQPVGVGGGGRWFDGAMAHVAMFTNALNGAQIQNLFNAAGVPPVVRIQPVSEGAFTGSTVSIPASVSGSAPLSYQWYKTGSPVSGQTTSSLSFNPVAAGNAGNYFLVATNTYGSVTSATITVTVSTGGAYASAVRSLNPVGYWPLNESTQPPVGQY
ncbi:MAG TPA: LamG-like jellyroll fold domain-containing protein, partial [Candidatus Dormibacteraeota bacterium]|nr:LamG-like jellyroll fold domain-containing protein [Candidatus Dormibacteraeota bacterium]